MKLYFWNSELFDLNQKTNYIKIILARKREEIEHNKELHIQKNPIIAFFKINKIHILIENFFLNNITKSFEKKNILTFFFIKNDEKLYNFIDFNKEGQKIKVLVFFDHEYYKKLYSIENFNSKANKNDINYVNDTFFKNYFNNEFIHGIIVKIF